MKNTVKDKKRPSQPRLDAERIFYKKWLIFSKLHVLTENGVRPRKTVISTHNNEKQFRTKTVFLNQDFNQNACFNKQWLIFSKTQVLTQNGVRRKKLCFQHKIMKNIVQQRKRLSETRLDAKRIFYKKWLIFSKTQVLTENGVTHQKTLLSTQNNEKHSSRQKTSFST